MKPTKRLTASNVTIIVPVGGVASAWERCAGSLARLDPAPAEIVVVIDGPNEGLAATAATIDAKVLVLEERGGPARARNHGAKIATGDLLLFVDSDIEVPSDLVAKVAEVFTEHGELAAAIGSYDDSPGDPGFLSQYRNLLHHFVHQNGREMASTFWAGCGAIRRLAFEQVGGFDESYANPSIEDIDLGAKLVRSGNAIRLVKTLQVKHLKRWSLANMLATDLFRRAIPWTQLMLGEGQLVNDLNVKTRDRLSVVFAFLLPVALVGASWWPPLLAAAALSLVLLIALNAGLFQFFLRVRGLGFAARMLPFYWIYLLICGIGFAVGLLRHFLEPKQEEGAQGQIVGRGEQSSAQDP